MKKFLLLSTLMVLVVATSCNKDDDDGDTIPDYHIHIDGPTDADKMVGDVIPINITVEDHDGKTVHHVKMRIYKDGDESVEIFNKPGDAHVHEEDGKFEFNEDFTLNVDPHTDWVFEVKAWGHEAGLAEKTSTVKFHVHPN